MSTELKVTEAGEDLVIVIPRSVAEELHIQKGDSLFVSRSRSAAVEPYPSEKVRRQMEVARRVMRENQNLLSRLAQ